MTREDLIAAVVTVLVPALAALVRLWLKDKDAERAQMLRWAVDVAYNVTNEVAKHTETKVDDKVAHALGVFREALAVSGASPTAEEEKAAQLAWKAMHGAEKEAEALALRAAAAGRSVAADVPRP